MEQLAQLGDLVEALVLIAGLVGLLLGYLGWSGAARQVGTITAGAAAMIRAIESAGAGIPQEVQGRMLAAIAAGDMSAAAAIWQAWVKTDVRARSEAAGVASELHELVQRITTAAGTTPAG